MKLTGRHIICVALRLRKSILMAAAAACACSAAANDPCAVPFFDTARPDRIIEIGIHAGDGVSTIRQNYASNINTLTDFVLTPGNRFIAGASAVMPVRNFFAVGTGLDFAVNNFYWTMTMLDRGDGVLTSLYSRNHYCSVEVPVFMQWRFNLGANVSWRTDIGFYLSFGAGGHSRYKVATSSTNSLGQSQVTESSYRDKYYNDPSPVINTINPTDWGLHLGTGLVLWRHFDIRGVMHVGARDIAKNMGVLHVKVHTLNVAVTAGYIF